MTRLFKWLALIIFVASGPAFAGAKTDYEGFYWTEKKDAIVQLALLGESIEGRTVWSETKDGVDVNNPDETLKERPLVGMVFLSGFEYAAKKNRWKDGKVYDPNNGKTYDAKMALKNGGETLEMRGYIGISLFGRTAKFARLTDKNTSDGLLVKFTGGQ